MFETIVGVLAVIVWGLWLFMVVKHSVTTGERVSVLDALTIFFGGIVAFGLFLKGVS